MILQPMQVRDTRLIQRQLLQRAIRCQGRKIDDPTPRQVQTFQPRHMRQRRQIGDIGVLQIKGFKTGQPRQGRKVGNGGASKVHRVQRQQICDWPKVIDATA